MAENTKMGREPITKCTLKLDQCTRSWGDGTCKAGLYNLLIDSATPSNTAAWNVYGWIITTGQTDPASGTDAFLLEKDGFTGSGFEALAENTAGVGEYLYYTIYAKAVLNITDIRVLVALPSASNADFNFNFSTQVETNSVAWEAFDYVSVTDQGSDWYKIELGILSSRSPTSELSFNLLNGGTEAPDGAQALIYGLQVTPNLNQIYAETTGTPLTANSLDPCFNTRFTCQDPANYDRGTLPLKFVKSRAPLPNDDYYLPAMESISIGAAQLNPGGANKSSSPFGQRGTISVTFKDFPHNDKLVDPYVDQRDYDPLTRGTFFTKLLARNPYYMHRLIEIESGYLVETNDNSAYEITDSITRTFVITSFDGVDSDGVVRISGKDVLAMAESSKAQAPRTSTGRLAASLDSGSGAGSNFTLTPSGVGDLEYPASGYVRIEKEVLEFTRSGDVMTPVTRGAWGTDAEAHDGSTNPITVQLCLHIDAQLPADILYDLFLNYANIPAAYLDKANWDIEGNTYLPRLYTTLITEPTGISTLVGEMCEQMFFSTWWDERDNLVKVRAVRAPQDDVIHNLTDDAHLIKDSVSWKDLPDQLVTEVNVYYGQINATEKLDEARNYSTVFTVLNGPASSADKYGINKIKTIFSRWIPASAAAAAEDLADKIANRFGEIPKQVSFQVDAKDSYLWLGDFVRMQNRLMLDPNTALPRLADMQIFSANEAEMGSRFKYIANEFFLAQPETVGAFNVTIASNLLNVNLRELFDSQIGITLTGTETINFTVRSGVVIGGDTAGGGTNVAEDQRIDTNDYYDGGTASLGGRTVGTIPFLQRQGIVSDRTISKDATYPGTSDAVNWDVIEKPVSVALDTGTFPVGTTINLILESGAYIDGEGGNGGCHTFKTSSGVSSALIPLKGGDGGDALNIQHPINVYNSGIITAGCAGGAGVCIESTASSLIMGSGAPGAGSLTNRYINGILNTTRSTPSNARISDVTAASSSIVFGSQIPGGNAYKCSWDAGFLITEGAPGGGGDSDSVFGGGNTFQTQAEARAAEVIYKSQTNIVYGTATFSDVAQPGNAIKSGANLINWVIKGDVRGTENI